MSYTYKDAIYDLKLAQRKYIEADPSFRGIHQQHPVKSVNLYLKSKQAGFLIVSVIESEELFFVCDETGNNIELSEKQKLLFRDAVDYLYTKT